jgi:hypothetical protein
MAGGGIGEAMLIGAAVGGGSAAVTGGDPLKGALLGGLTGGAGAGIGGALGGAAGGAGAGTTAAATAGVEGALANALPLTSTGTIATTAAPTTLASTGSLPAGMNFAQASQAANQAANLASNAAITQGTNAAMANALPLTANAGMPFSSAIGTGGVSNLPAASTAAAPSSFQTAMQNPLNYIKANPLSMGSAGIAGALGGRRPMEEEEEYSGPLSRFRFNPESYRPAFYAGGGIASLPSGYDRMVGEMPMYQSMARGGISDLGSYSDGGRMLKGPGDGMSDSIPGVIANKRPARLADGEFVVPADVVSGLGNGSTDAGAKQLYAMMDKVRKARTGTKKQGREINPRKYVPA